MTLTFSYPAFSLFPYFSSPVSSHFPPPSTPTFKAALCSHHNKAFSLVSDFSFKPTSVITVPPQLNFLNCVKWKHRIPHFLIIWLQLIPSHWNKNKSKNTHTPNMRVFKYYHLWLPSSCTSFVVWHGCHLLYAAFPRNTSCFLLCVPMEGTIIYIIIYSILYFGYLHSFVLNYGFLEG